MVLRFEITATLEKTQGKFMSKEEAAEQVISEIEASNPNEVTGGTDGTSTYEVTEWEVQEVTS